MEITKAKFACLDTETTGLSPLGGGKICELAISVSAWNEKSHRFEQEGSFQSLFNPQIPMLPEVIAIHGITNEMVATAPTFEEQAPNIVSLLENCIIVAHNAEFDVGFLKSEFEQIGLNFPDCQIVDTLKLARKSGLFKSNRLGAIAQELNIDNCGWHRAMADTKMAEQIFYHFIKILSEKGIHTTEDLNRCQEKRWDSLFGR